MSAGVERFPAGVRELLGFRDAPPAFQFFSELFLPTLEMSGFYLLSLRATASNTVSATAIQDQTPLIVPVGEIWLLSSLQFSTGILDADQACTAAIFYQAQGANFNGPEFIAGNSERGHSTLYPGDLQSMLLRAGDEIAGNIDSLTVGAAGSVECRTRALFARLGG